MKNLLLASVAAAGVLAWAASASAAVEVLNFAGLSGNEEEPLNYYSGGFGSLGNGPGPNYGITFPSNVLAASSATTGGCCNTAEIPGGTGANAIFFVNGASDAMDVPGGFTTGFSFYYSAPVYTGSVTVWSGLDGTGTLLATLDLPLTTADGDPGCDGYSYCPYSSAGVTFSGTAESAEFGGVANYVAFADITLGSPTAGGGGGAVPEPASMALLGAGLAGLGAIRRRKRA